MTALRFPLRDAVPYPVDDPSAQRLWRGIVERRTRRSERSTRRGVLLWFAVGAMAATALMIGYETFRSRPSALVSTVDAGPLLLADGRAFGAVEAPAGTWSVESRLADGSKLLLDPGARIEPLENGSRSLVLLLVRGRAAFDVHPGGPRRWSIECGLATVEVVGTRFVLRRSENRLIVEVEHGTVLVRGERVRDRVQRLTAGGRLEVGSTTETEAPRAPGAAPPGAEPPTSAAAAVPAPRAWRDLATRGAYADAYRLLGPEGVGSEVARSASVEDLMSLADVARLSGHAADAVGPLARVVTEHPDDPRASLAAFTLGKIHLNTLGQATVSVSDFERAIIIGLPKGLLEDAYAYLVEAKTKTGDRAGARASAEAFARRFPDSERARSLLKGLGGP